MRSAPSTESDEMLTMRLSPFPGARRAAGAAFQPRIRLSRTDSVGRRPRGETAPPLRHQRDAAPDSPEHRHRGDLLTGEHDAAAVQRDGAGERAPLGPSTSVRLCALMSKLNGSSASTPPCRTARFLTCSSGCGNGAALARFPVILEALPLMVSWPGLSRPPRSGRCRADPASGKHRALLSGSPGRARRRHRVLIQFKIAELLWHQASLRKTTFITLFSSLAVCRASDWAWPVWSPGVKCQCVTAPW